MPDYALFTIEGSDYSGCSLQPLTAFCNSLLTKRKKLHTQNLNSLSLSLSEESFITMGSPDGAWSMSRVLMSLALICINGHRVEEKMDHVVL